MTSQTDFDTGTPAPTPETEHAKPLTPAAMRASQEAQARRQAAGAEASAKEVGGRAGPDPVRYGDWETGGIASDF